MLRPAQLEGCLVSVVRSTEGENLLSIVTQSCENGWNFLRNAESWLAGSVGVIVASKGITREQGAVL